MNEYRHVCFKDLDNYFKRDDYFSDLTSQEKKLVRKNLGLSIVDDIDKGFIVQGTYSEIKNLVDNSMLVLSTRYIITDYQTIYRANTGEVWGNLINPSKVYSILLTPASSNEFEKQVILLENNEVLDWEVYYDFQQEKIDGTYTKGKILYLRDQNNNSAYYDFKNIKYRINISSTDIPGISRDVELDLYTFNEATSDPFVFVENSDDMNIINNHFEKDCNTNIFLGITNNNTFAGGFKNNIFLKDCQYNNFGYNMYNNKFLNSVMYCSGALRNKTVTNLDNSVEKEFIMVGDDFAIKYLDTDTLTYQIEKL